MAADGTAAGVRIASGGGSQVARSFYLSLREDRKVSGRGVLLSARLALPKADTVFVESDGSYAPMGTDVVASIFIRLDGRRVSDESTTDWRGSFDVVAHSFDAIGAASLAAGRHTVELVGRALAGSFTVAASSNLSVFVHPAQKVAVSRLQARRGHSTSRRSAASVPTCHTRRSPCITSWQSSSECGRWWSLRAVVVGESLGPTLGGVREDGHAAGAEPGGGRLPGALAAATMTP